LMLKRCDCDGMIHQPCQHGSLERRKRWSTSVDAMMRQPLNLRENWLQSMEPVLHGHWPLMLASFIKWITFVHMQYQLDFKINAI
jgi:hypothetical protein